MKLAALLGFVLVFSMACAGEPEPEPPTEPLKLLALGDSYTIGENVGKLESWPVQLIRELRVSGVSAAEPTVIAATGWDTSDLEQAIHLTDLQGPFDVVTLQIGVNNQFRRGSLDDFRDGLERLTDLAIDLTGGKPNKVIFVSIPDWGVTPFAEGAPRNEIADEIDAFNDVVREISETSKTRFVDVTEISRRAATERDLVALDGLHPSGNMYAEWVELILPEVREVTGI